MKGWHLWVGNGGRVALRAEVGEKLTKLRGRCVILAENGAWYGINAVRSGCWRQLRRGGNILAQDLLNK